MHEPVTALRLCWSLPIVGSMGLVRGLLLLGLGLLSAAIAMTPVGVGQLAYIAVYYVALAMLCNAEAAAWRPARRPKKDASPSWVPLA